MADQEMKAPVAATATVAATTQTPAPAASAAVAEKVDEPVEITLTHFGIKLSKEAGRRVELVHGFIHTEKMSGKFKDTEANYRARYKAFLTAEPV